MAWPGSTPERWQTCGHILSAVRRHVAARVLLCLVLLGVVSGCTSLRTWWNNGLKVGPNFSPPPAPVLESWTHLPDTRMCDSPCENCAWWSLFNDPVLDALIDRAYRENLDLKRASAHILESRFVRNRTRGNLLPQSQSAIGAYAHGQISKTLTQGALNNLFDIWVDGVSASWEIDFWGRFRRELEGANADLDAASEDYRDMLVILLSDVTTNYVRLRGYQQRLDYAERNVEIQKGALSIAQQRFKAGKAPEMDVQQARLNLAQTESTIPPLLTGLWETNNQLCVLLGIPAQPLCETLERHPIPAAPLEVMVGIPADLLRRRPDIRRAEREAASQSAKIGVAEADFYPSVSIFGFLGYTANEFKNLFREPSFTGFVIPSFSWKILNYGRLRNNVRAEDARLQQKILAYQQLVLRAGSEVESAIVAFLQAESQVRSLSQSVEAADRLAAMTLDQYREGSVDFNRVYNAEEALVGQQDRLAGAQQQRALSLIRIYRALGGGWEIFQPECEKKDCRPTAPCVQAREMPAPSQPEHLPAPTPAEEESHVTDFATMPRRP